MRNLNAEAIVAIIKAGAEAQVAMLELGTIKITYKGSEPVLAQPQPIHINLDTPNPQPQQQGRNPQLDELDELLLDLTNPGEFERRKLLGDTLNAEA